jgi:hypothetical protein
MGWLRVLLFRFRVSDMPLTWISGLKRLGCMYSDAGAGSIFIGLLETKFFLSLRAECICQLDTLVVGMTNEPSRCLFVYTGLSLVLVGIFAWILPYVLRFLLRSS